jgi:hypothetical protein
MCAGVLRLGATGVDDMSHLMAGGSAMEDVCCASVLQALAPGLPVRTFVAHLLRRSRAAAGALKAAARRPAVAPFRESRLPHRLQVQTAGAGAQAASGRAEVLAARGLPDDGGVARGVQEEGWPEGRADVDPPCCKTGGAS